MSSTENAPASWRDPRVVAPGAAYVALAVLDTRLAGHPDPRVRRRRLLTKPLLMPTLAAAFARATAGPVGDGRNSAGSGGSRDWRPLRRGVLAAQALSGAGDVALLGQGERAFLAGLGSFFGAHIAYVAAFASQARPWSDRSHRTGLRVAAGTFAALGPSLGWAAGRRSPELRGPVVAYAGILTSMVAASSRLGDHLSPASRRVVVLGTATFLASDATIALRRFVLPAPRPRSDAVVMATYTAGQGLIAAGVAAAVRAPRGSAPR